MAVALVAITVPVRLGAQGERVTPVSRLEALAEARPGEPPWLPVFRLRAAERQYRRDSLWYVYIQVRAQAEAFIGNDSTALAFFDRIPVRSKPVALPSGLKAVPAVQVLTAAADTAQVIMINEAHHVIASRLLTLKMLPILWAKGFRYFALEDLSATDSGLARRGYPLQGKTGYYTTESVFGEMLREALRLGYRLVPYEEEPSQDDTTDGLNSQQRRDSIEALNLAMRIFRDDPHAKVLVHAGFEHVSESIDPYFSPMAVYFRKRTGIDPVTVDQTELSERAPPRYEAPAYRAALAAGLVRDVPVVLFDSKGVPYRAGPYHTDFEVFTPPTKHDHGRPTWMTLFGTRVPIDMQIEQCKGRTCVAEARLATEPDSAVALDRAELTRSGTVRLFVLPARPIRVRVWDASGAIVRTLEP